MSLSSNCNQTGRLQETGECNGVDTWLIEPDLQPYWSSEFDERSSDLNGNREGLRHPFPTANMLMIAELPRWWNWQTQGI